MQIFLTMTIFGSQVENVRMIDKYNTRNPVIGTLYVTTTQLIFAYPDSNKETWVSFIIRLIVRILVTSDSSSG